ncbi:hypothetical protein ABIE39_001325 [Cellulosimicrobium sp. 4261]
MPSDGVRDAGAVRRRVRPDDAAWAGWSGFARARAGRV